MAAAPLVSIIVFPAPTDRCREAVAAQTHAAHELVVADQRSIAPGAGGDVLAYLDADAVPHPNWLAAALSCLDADPALGVVAPLRFAADHPLVLAGAGGGLTRRGDRLPLASGVPYEFAVLPTAVPYAPRCGLLARRAVLDAVGPLDLFGDGGGDLDLGLRAWALGWRVAVCPDAWVDGCAAPETPVVTARERTRIALSYFPARHLRACLRRELASAPAALLAWAWHPHRLRAAWRVRRRFAAGAGTLWPLLAPIWETPPRRALYPGWRRPDPCQARAVLQVDGKADAAQLGFGWYAEARDAGRAYRRTAAVASAVVRLTAPVDRCRVFWRGPRALETVALTVRPWGERTPRWQAVLAPPPEVWEQRRLACALPAGDYEVLLRCAPPTWDAEGRERGVDVAAIEFDPAR